MGNSEIGKGDRFQSSDSIYTVTNVDGNKVHWDCEGRIVFYRIVSVQNIESWIAEGRLTKLTTPQGSKQK